MSDVEKAAREIFEDFWGEPAGKGNSMDIVRRTCEAIERHCRVTKTRVERDAAVAACKAAVDEMCRATFCKGADQRGLNWAIKKCEEVIGSIHDTQGGGDEG
jgi:hypothetical protein